jgi:hypothetical protein
VRGFDGQLPAEAVNHLPPVIAQMAETGEIGELSLSVSLPELKDAWRELIRLRDLEATG